MPRNLTLVKGTLAVAASLALATAAFADDTHKQKAIAHLFGSSTTKGWVQYDDHVHGSDLTQRLRVHVERAAPDADVPVLVNDVLIATVHTNGGGTGKIDLRSNPKEPDDPVLPAGFPRLDTGDMVTVGDTTGVFFDSDDAHTQKVKLEGQGTDESGQSAEVKYQEKFHKGVLQRRFKVEVSGAVEGETFDIFVNDVLVGTITAVQDDDDDQGETGASAELQLRSDAHGGHDGHGPQPLPESFPSLQPNDTVTVGNIVVILAAPGGDDGDGG